MTAHPRVEELPSSACRCDAAKPTVYFGTFIHTPSPGVLSVLTQHAVFVNPAGHIVAILPTTSPAFSASSVPGFEHHTLICADAHKNQFFFPGFIDTHIHASQYPNAGIFGSSTLLDWLEKYTFPLEASLSDAEKARKVYTRCIKRTIAAGTTTAAYYATRDVESTNLLATLCLQFGQRALVGRCCMDRLAPDYYRDQSATAAYEDTKKCIAHCSSLSSLVTPVITPRFAPSCTNPLLESLGALAKETDLPIQTHISENTAELELVKKFFPAAPHYAGVYDSFGLLTSRTILAHGVYLTPEEIELIKKRGAGISHCPVSNLSLTSGMAPVRCLVDAGINVGLGTDVSGGYSASVLEAVRQATLVSRMVSLRDGQEGATLSVADALYLGTRGGANVVGLGDKVGAFEVGMEWDAMLVGLGGAVSGGHREPAEEGVEVTVNGDRMEGYVYGGRKSDYELDLREGPVDVFGWEHWEDKVAKWVYSGDERNTLGVWVKGRRVYANGGGMGRFSKPVKGHDPKE